MAGSIPRTAEFAMPLASLAALRRALAESLGADNAARALRRAGYVAGDALFEALARAGGQRPDRRAPDGAAADALQALDEEKFWQRLRELFASRGWGRLTVAKPHAGAGSLESEDWAEAMAAGQARRPACFFTAGALASVLGHAAGQPVAVLEVECRARGDERCRFLFGSQETLGEVYRGIGSGVDADHALASL